VLFQRGLGRSPSRKITSVLGLCPTDSLLSVVRVRRRAYRAVRRTISRTHQPTVRRTRRRADRRTVPRKLWACSGYHVMWTYAYDSEMHMIVTAEDVISRCMQLPLRCCRFVLSTIPLMTLITYKLRLRFDVYFTRIWPTNILLIFFLST
jgi:hypothetical protein